MTVAKTNEHAYDTLIFDIGDVLFTWSAETRTTISPKTLHKILQTATWFEFEKGKISEAESYATVAREFGLEAKEVEEAFQGARDSLTSRLFMVNLIRELKPGRRVYAMSNISAPDWEVLRTKGADWDIFDGVFTSAAAGERKPNLGYYRHVLKVTGADPKRTIFVMTSLRILSQLSPSALPPFSTTPFKMLKGPFVTYAVTPSPGRNNSLLTMPVATFHTLPLPSDSEKFCAAADP